MTINIYTNLEKDSALFQQLEKQLTDYPVRLVAAVKTHHLAYAVRGRAILWLARTRRTRKNLQVLAEIQNLAYALDSLSYLLKGKVKQNEKTTAKNDKLESCMDCGKPNLVLVNSMFCFDCFENNN